MEHFLQNCEWRLVDESNLQSRSPLASFAMDDTLCHLVGHHLSTPVIRTWIHKESVVLGIQDHRLPFIEQGMRLLNEQGYTPIVRNSGGLAVVLDTGVLNISLVISEKEQPLSINSAFELMVQFIKILLPEIAEHIEAYEIVGSYCPGSYDLSIAGKKFAGISQRRMQGGVAVQIYLCVEGSGSERAELIKQFYEISLKNEETKFQYPRIEPSVMASLQELTGTDITAVELNLRIQQMLQQKGFNWTFTPLQPSENELYMHYLQRVLQRNQSMLSK
ncbi:lipoate--protein ligase family protein [Metasolibacillus meyeri]|uniref:Octanoyl-[GcvH]:protein N-octanoyltransferase n=1 Tax=Metasolibacillus meyeri TaxID=1071052 RepID=A0AAW9NLT8_9BACL|nr:lipoate--protein ligase family protein [Metasolibacillus meyeri]MEC1176915.1 lipoate--protein ligase family protein [Metasolibacillus meyeri]